MRVKSLDPSTLTPGRERVWLELLSGDQVSAGYIPVEVAKAEVEGPTVAIVAAIHGDELNGTATVQQVSRLLNERPLVAGTLMMIPVLNLHGFGTRQRWFMDNRDLNREMASPVELTPMFQKPSQRFGERLLRRLIDHVDYLLDLHTATTG